MTILVGIACADGAVIGADSKVTFAPVPGSSTISLNDQTKVEIVGDRVIIAHTGWVGLADRAVAEVKALWDRKAFTGDPLNVAILISETINQNFRKTCSPIQAQRGWETGALVAFPIGQKAYLFEFDQTHYNPELKGGKNPPIVSMGIGAPIADPHLGLIKRVFWPDGKEPNVTDGKFAVTWTLQHTIDLTTGAIGGDPQIAVLQKNKKGDWNATLLDRGDLGEAQENVRAVEAHLRKYSFPPGEEAAPTPPPKHSDKIGKD